MTPPGRVGDPPLTVIDCNNINFKLRERERNSIPKSTMYKLEKKKKIV